MTLAERLRALADALPSDGTAFGRGPSDGLTECDLRLPFSRTFQRHESL